MHMSERDKRKVSTDALETLGTIHTRPEKRDAIHLAVYPVKAGERLRPGEDITVVDGIATGEDRTKALGIVDPFLPGPVKKGERFWFIMYPRMVHSLRHVWTHPAFPDEVETPTGYVESVKVKAEEWIQKHADYLDISYSELMDAANEWLEHDDYKTQYDSESWRDDFDPEGFWPRYEIVTGITVPQYKRESFFSCSC